MMSLDSNSIRVRIGNNFYLLTRAIKLAKTLWKRRTNLLLVFQLRSFLFYHLNDYLRPFYTLTPEPKISNEEVFPFHMYTKKIQTFSYFPFQAIHATLSFRVIFLILEFYYEKIRVKFQYFIFTNKLLFRG